MAHRELVTDFESRRHSTSPRTGASRYIVPGRLI